MTRLRRVAGSATAIVVVLLSALAAPAQPASARSYYRYWSYWHKAPGATSWQYSSVGASGYYLKQGSQVEGWRYDVGTASPSDPQPRPTSVTYDQYCGGKNADKTYRVLLVVDYGTESSAPAGPVYSCYGFDDSVTGYRVLTQQHTERDSGGLICAIDGYPKTGCGDTVSSPAPRTSPKRSTAPRPQPSAAAAQSAAPAATTTTRSTTSVTATSAAPGKSAASAVTTQPTSSVASSAPQRTTTLRPFTGAPKASTSSVPVGLIIGLAGLLALAGGAVWLRRRSP